MVGLFRLSLSWKMALATALGILFGLFFGDMASIFASWGAAYIMILKVTTVPYLIVAIIHGVGQLTTGQAKEIMKKGAIFIGIAWLINVSMVYFAALLFPAAGGTPHGSYLATEPGSVNFAELLIPENIFYSLSNNIIPSIVIFSLFIGISLMLIKEKQPMMSMLGTALKSLTTITAWISRITPLGTFIIIANQAGTIQLTTVQQVGTYILLYVVTLSLVCFWIFPRLTSALTGIPALTWIKNMLPILILAYTTNLVIVCLPYIIALIEKTTKQLDPGDKQAQNQIQGTVSIVFNLPLGSIFIALFILFISEFYHTPLNFASNIQMLLTTFLTALGSSGIGSWLNSITFLLDTLALPLDAIDLFLTSLPFTSGFQSMVSTMQIASVSLFIILACRKQLSFKWMKIFRSSVVSAVPLLLLLVGISWHNPLPKLENRTPTIYDLLLRSDVEVKVFTEKPTASGSPEDAFDRIMRTKVLRVGYNPNSAPFCFYNKHRDLVGYDMAFAYELAHDLGVSLELIPLDYAHLSEELNSGLYDVAMAATSVSERRLKHLSFTHFYAEGRICFVARDAYRKKFSDLDRLKQDDAIRIAVFKGSVFESLARKLFPHQKIVPILSYDEFARGSIADLLLWSEQEAVAWSLQHPSYAVVFPTPSLGMNSLGYAMNKDAVRFLAYMNDWLALKKNRGFTEKNYSVWVLGQISSDQEKQPRYSIIRNVLHWVK